MNTQTALARAATTVLTVSAALVIAPVAVAAVPTSSIAQLRLPAPRDDTDDWVQQQDQLNQQMIDEQQTIASQQQAEEQNELAQQEAQQAEQQGLMVEQQVQAGQ